MSYSTINNQIILNKDQLNKYYLNSKFLIVDNENSRSNYWKNFKLLLLKEEKKIIFGYVICIKCNSFIKTKNYDLNEKIKNLGTNVLKQHLSICNFSNNNLNKFLNIKINFENNIKKNIYKHIINLIIKNNLSLNFIEKKNFLFFLNIFII